MWAIKATDLGMYGFLQYMYVNKKNELILEFHKDAYAFRFPDEQTAQAVLKFLNRDNLEVVCIDHPGSN